MILGTDKDGFKTNEHYRINETLTKKEKHKFWACNILQCIKTNKVQALV
jgi:hypothetical protein